MIPETATLSHLSRKELTEVSNELRKRFDQQLVFISGRIRLCITRSGASMELDNSRTVGAVYELASKINDYAA